MAKSVFTLNGALHAIEKKHAPKKNKIRPYNSHAPDRGFCLSRGAKRVLRFDCVLLLRHSPRYEYQNNEVRDEPGGDYVYEPNRPLIFREPKRKKRHKYDVWNR